MKRYISIAGSIIYIRYSGGWEFVIDLEDNFYPIGLDYFGMCDQTFAIKKGWA